MIPIGAIKDGQLVDLRTDNLYNDIVEICREHRATNKALAFGLLLFNTRNPQIYKILEDKKYWTALNDISGKYISLFYIKKRDHYFGQDLIESDGLERRNLYEVTSNENLIPIIKELLDIKGRINYPSILFFQEHEGFLTDYLIVELNERKIQDSFWELYDYIEKAVEELEYVQQENYGNSREIFELLKSGVEHQNFRVKFSRYAQKFPIQLLVSWVTGKI